MSPDLYDFLPALKIGQKNTRVTSLFFHSTSTKYLLSSEGTRVLKRSFGSWFMSRRQHLEWLLCCAYIRGVAANLSWWSLSAPSLKRTAKHCACPAAAAQCSGVLEHKVTRYFFQVIWSAFHSTKNVRNYGLNSYGTKKFWVNIFEHIGQSLQLTLKVEIQVFSKSLLSIQSLPVVFSRFRPLAVLISSHLNEHVMFRNAVFRLCTEFPEIQTDFF